MSQPTYGSVPNPQESQLNRGYGTQSSTGVSDFAQGIPSTASPLSQSAAQQPGAFHEDFDASQRGSSVVGDGDQGFDRSASTASTAVPASAPSRSNTLKKKSSVRRSASTKSLKRSGSKRSLKAGSIKGVAGRANNEDFNSVFYTPIPTQSSPTEILANRFQAWRQLLKSLITYFREIQDSYDARAKAIRKVQNTISNITNPTIFMSQNGLGEATRMLDDYHKRSMAEANKSRDIESDVIGALTGLRSDLGQKIKEIKSLSGDFKNSVDKEKESTRREVEKLQEALQHADHEDGNVVGRNDPFVVRLGVDRQVEKQIDEENYLHRAYLNLENSGRELESIVVGEIQKAYNALAGILKREADDAYHVVEGLRSGPISMPKEQEWLDFVTNDPHFVDPDVPVRRIEDIEYPGKHHPAASEVRAGMLERKSKYLKSYTAGWYVLSPTHLHEFKSADKIYSQPPVMSLYLLDQKLGSKSDPGSSSHKFMLKGKQSGSMHKGHNWVFRAETHETMLAWYEDIRVLTETTGEQRNAFVRKHARSVSGYSDRGTVSSDGMEDDEADVAPYSADAASLNAPEEKPQRPQPGGRFPSDLHVPRSEPLSPSSGSSEPDRDVVAAAGAIPGSTQSEYDRNGQDPYHMSGIPSGSRVASYNDPNQFAQRELQQQQYLPEQAYTQPSNVNSTPVQTQTYALPLQQAQPVNQQQTPLSSQQTQPIGQQQAPSQQQPQQTFLGGEPAGASSDPLDRPNSMYGNWMAPAAAGVAGVGAGALGTEAYKRHQRDAAMPEEEEQPERALPVMSSMWRGGAPEENVTAFGANGGDATPTQASSSSADPSALFQSAAGKLGGLEGKGAHETGSFPTVVRHNTDMSVSNLHVPGEYPKRV
ncbi:hypothetical protein LTR85_010700 [Meristemomyces frigidus]|nr:hypothetical protein LTR85_010700 [Meristemomyces frigidus]